jgi:hypothetical protein
VPRHSRDSNFHQKVVSFQHPLSSPDAQCLAPVHGGGATTPTTDHRPPGRLPESRCESASSRAIRTYRRASRARCHPAASQPRVPRSPQPAELNGCHPTDTSSGSGRRRATAVPSPIGESMPRGALTPSAPRRPRPPVAGRGRGLSDCHRGRSRHASRRASTSPSTTAQSCSGRVLPRRAPRSRSQRRPRRRALPEPHHHRSRDRGQPWWPPWPHRPRNPSRRRSPPTRPTARRLQPRPLRRTPHRPMAQECPRRRPTRRPRRLRLLVSRSCSSNRGSPSAKPATCRGKLARAAAALPRQPSGRAPSPPPRAHRRARRTPRAPSTPPGARGPLSQLSQGCHRRRSKAPSALPPASPT